MPQPLRLIGRTSSINVQKVLWALHELDIPFRQEDAGGAFGIVDTPDYRALNPNGLVPTLVDGDFALWESNAIVRHLARQRPEAGLLPADPRRRAVADQWMDWQGTNATPALRDAFWGLVRTAPEARDAGAVARSVAASEAKATLLDGVLAGRPYLAGDAFSAADIAVGCHVQRWRLLPIARPDLPHLNAWHGRLAARPASRAVFDLPLT